MGATTAAHIKSPPGQPSPSATQHPRCLNSSRRVLVGPLPNHHSCAWGCARQATIMSLSWDDIKWTWKHPDFYIFVVSSERLNGNCCTLSSPTGNIVWLALRRGDEEPRVVSAIPQRLICPYSLLRDVIVLPLLLTLQVGSASSSPSVASPAERDDLSFSRL